MILARRSGVQFLIRRFKSMKQLDVEQPDIQKKLGSLQMNLIQKAEKLNSQRAEKFVKFRRNDLMVGGFCFSIAVGIYCYTIFAIKQEKFLDDFEMPDPLLPVPNDKN